MQSITKKINWVNLKNINSSKFINSMYIWIFLVPIFVKVFELITKESYKFFIFGEIIPIQLSLPFSLIYFYFSAVFFAIGNIIIQIRCPIIIKDNNSYNDFLNSGKKLLQLSEYVDDISFNWGKLANEVDKKIDSEYASPINIQALGIGTSTKDQEEIYKKKNNPQNYFWQIYDVANLTRKKSRYIIAISYFIGFILFIIVLFQNFLTIINILKTNI